MVKKMYVCPVCGSKVEGLTRIEDRTKGTMYVCSMCYRDIKAEESKKKKL